MEREKWIEGILGETKKKAMPILSFPCISLMGISVSDLISDSSLQAKGMKMIANRVNSLAAVSMMDLSVEAEAFGSTVRVSGQEVPTITGRIINSLEDAQNIVVPDVFSGRTGLYVEAIREACQLIVDRPVFAGVIGPFSLAGRLMDVSEIMINCYVEPKLVYETMEKTTQFIINYINEYKKTGASGVIMAEPLTGLLSPELAAEFSNPFVKKIVDAVQDDKFIFIYHNCGNNTIQMIDSILSIGATAYHFGNAINIKEMLKLIPKNIIVMGNVDPSSQFKDGTVDSIKEKTKSLLEECSAYNNFVISSGCDIPPLSKWENIDAFFEAVENFYDR